MPPDEQLETSRYTWPHRTSHIFACLSCTIGMYNINRFAYLVYQYKGPFIVQFLILSIVLGLPFYFLLMALGNSMSNVGADLWSISPAFKGLGIAMIYLNAIIGTYSSLPLSWFLRYFRDSFITTDESYKWSHCHSTILKDKCGQNRSYLEVIGSAVPSYLHVSILRRKPNTFNADGLQFEPSFSLAIIWVIVFICLCYKLKFYGKVIFVLSLTPLILLSIILVRFMEEWGQGIRFIFETSWSENMRDSWSWLLAAREVVIIWIMFSDVILQICSCNKQEVPIVRSFVIVATLTFYALIASTFLFFCGTEAVKEHNASYLRSSYEDVTAITAVKYLNISRPDHTQIVNLWVGENSVTPPGSKEPNGYQPIRFSTELFPAVFALEGPRQLSSFWAITFYAMILMFGIGQQVSIWWCVVNSVVTMNSDLLRPWETLVTFGLCSLGYGFSLPIATNVGISIIYYLDCCIGSLWWILFLFFVMLIAIIFIEGKPYSLEQMLPSIAKGIIMKNFIIPFLVVIWDVILPVAYLVMSVVFLRASQYEMNFPWTSHRVSWHQWSRYLGVIIQISPLIIVASICFTQLCVYLCKRPDGTSFEGVELCCCCVDSELNSRRRSTVHSLSTGEVDTPPKYTPPPSYSTATSRAVRNVLRRVSTSIELTTISVTPSSLPDLVSYTESSS